MDFKAKLPILSLLPLLLTSAFSFPLDLDNSDDPAGQLEQCRERCMSERPYQARQHCKAVCHYRYETQIPNEDTDPQKQLHQCRRGCQGGRRCEERCKEAFEGQQGNRREDEEERYPRGERRYEECQRKCEREGRGQSKQWQCQRRCQEDFQRERQEGGRGRGGRGEGGREYSGRRCRRQCEEQGYGFDCARRCRGQHHDGDGAVASLLSFFA